MAKYLIVDPSTGRLKQATGLSVSTGAPDANKLVETDGSGVLDSSLLPPGVVTEVLTIQASENLSAGDMVNIHLVSGNARVRRADASSDVKQAHGYVLASVTSGNNATVYFGNKLTGLSSLTIGSEYFLSASTPGAVTTTVPTTAGHIVQRIGVAYSATELLIEIGETIELA